MCYPRVLPPDLVSLVHVSKVDEERKEMDDKSQEVVEGNVCAIKTDTSRMCRAKEDRDRLGECSERSSQSATEEAQMKQEKAKETVVLAPGQENTTSLIEKDENKGFSQSLSVPSASHSLVPAGEPDGCPERMCLSQGGRARTLPRWFVSSSSTYNYLGWGSVMVSLF